MKKAVIISCFDWYKSRLEPIRENLMERGYDVTVFTSDFNHVSHSPITKYYPECDYIHVPTYHRNISFRRIYSHIVFAVKIRRLLELLRPDFVYCLIPPNYLADKCRHYKAHYPNVKIVFDIIDLWPESLPIDKTKNTLPAKIWGHLRDNALSCADIVFTECDYYQDVLTNTVEKNKFRTLRLYKTQTDKEKETIKRIIEKREVINSTIKLAYVGSMNNILDIDGICNVVQTIINNGLCCELHAIGDGESRLQFEQALSSIGCKTHFYGMVFDEIEKISILAPCDFALNMMKSDVAVGFTIKSIDYLSYGLPILNNIKGDTWSFVDLYHLGINVTDNFDQFNATELKTTGLDIVSFYENNLSKSVFIDCVNSIFDKCKI